MVRLDDSDFGCYILQDLESDQSVLIQTDLDRPSVAANMGWMACPCGETDGTVRCEHRSVLEMINDATQFLDDHIGDTFEDPGYFQ